jgi:hypothetical protein
MYALPDSGRAACWLNAWLAGRESADAVISGIPGPDQVAEFIGPGPGVRWSVALFLGEVRRWRVTRASTALPIPGDPLGLGGPAGFNADVLDVGEGVVLHGSGFGLVPSTAGDLARWTVQPAQEPRYLASVAEADHALRLATTEAADRLAELDVASWRPDVVDILLDVRAPAPVEPRVPFASARAARLAHDALRARRIVALADQDDGGAVSVTEAADRASALRPLDRAARAALVAATSTIDGR